MKTDNQKLKLDDTHFISGIFHIHSKYSHDGKKTINEIATRLKHENIKFCIITDHFEDFDEKGFNTFLSEIKVINEQKDILLIPGIEVQLLNSHIILFPVNNYDEIYKIVNEECVLCNKFIKIIAHPTKIGISDLEDLLARFDIDGIEIWNQQTDGNYIPSGYFIKEFVNAGLKGISRFYFGCDLHNIDYQINNFIYIKIDNNVDINLDYIIQKLRRGEFFNFNKKSKIYLKGNSNLNDLIYCMSKINKKAFLYGKIFQKIRSILKLFFEILPKSTRHQINNLKNFVRSKL